MDELRTALQHVFRDVFEDDALELRDNLTAADVEQWDSIRHVDLIIAIEHALGVRFATAEVARLKQPGQSVGRSYGWWRKNSRPKSPRRPSRQTPGRVIRLPGGKEQRHDPE